MNNDIVFKVLEMYLDGDLKPPEEHHKALRRFLIQKATEYNYKHDYILKLAFGIENMIELENKSIVCVDVSKLDNSFHSKYDIPLNIDLGRAQKYQGITYIQGQVLRGYHNDGDLLFDDQFLVKFKLSDSHNIDIEEEKYVPSKAILKINGSYNIAK